MQSCLSLLMIPAALIALLTGAGVAVDDVPLPPIITFENAPVAEPMTPTTIDDLTTARGAPFTIDIPDTWTWQYVDDAAIVAIAQDDTTLQELVDFEFGNVGGLNGSGVIVQQLPAFAVGPVDDLQQVAAEVFLLNSRDGTVVEYAGGLPLRENPAVVYTIDAPAADGFAVVVASPTHYMLAAGLTTNLEEDGPLLQAILRSIVLPPYSAPATD